MSWLSGLCGCMCVCGSGSSCEQCGAEVQDLKRCGRCFVAKYCSRACQTTHWKTGGHKSSCPGNCVINAARDLGILIVDF